MMDLHVVTGAFGYSGKYIATRLLKQGHNVRTLTNSMRRANPFGDQIEVMPFHWDRPDELAKSLGGAKVLYNTYWVRFNHSLFRHADAVTNTLALFAAAKQAGVERVVHVSITNPDEGCPLEYFSGKGRLERALIESGLSYAILRPTVLFGKEDILINNIAWALRHLPVFGLFGDGRYRLQPIYVDDLAALAVEQGQRNSNTIVDAIGPETFTYRDLVETIAGIIAVRRPVIGMPPRLAFAAGWTLGLLLGDVMITWPEVRGLMADLLCTDSPPTGDTRLTEWARENRNRLGIKYASELARRRDRTEAY